MIFNYGLVYFRVVKEKRVMLMVSLRGTTDHTFIENARLTHNQVTALHNLLYSLLHFQFNFNTILVIDSAKKVFRDKAWNTLRINHVSTTPRHPYFRIPGFKGVQEATQLFRDLDMYKNAKTVLVSIDKLYEGVRYVVVFVCVC